MLYPNGEGSKGRIYERKIERRQEDYPSGSATPKTRQYRRAETQGRKQGSQTSGRWDSGSNMSSEKVTKAVELLVYEA